MSGHERTETLRALIRCDGAMPAKAWEEDGREVVPVTSIGTPPELNLRVTELGTVVLRELNDRATDLVRIAAYAFAADQLLSKGGESDPHRRRWRRDLAMVVPVLAPEFWQQPVVVDALCQALGFATDDLWTFAFVKGRQSDHQLPFEIDQVAEHRGKRPDSVVMFSGGMDSLCAMVEAVGTGLSPIAVSHRASISTLSHQRILAERLRQRFPQWALPHLNFWVHQLGQEARERTRRTRGFLFAALGAAVAGQLGIPRVLLSDNGYVSANPAINGQLVGALNSRGTHPAFLRLVNRLLTLVFPDGVAIENTLADRTRSEALQILKEHGCADLIAETQSCANSRTSKEQPHCGVCSQCVDRRFATIHAGLEAVDPVTGYRVDIFRDSIQEGRAKTFAVSFVEFARRTANITPDDLMLDFPEFNHCLDLSGPDPSASAGRIHGVITRHATEVIEVLAREFRHASDSLAQGTLPKESLIVLASGAAGLVPIAEDPSDQARPTPSKAPELTVDHSLEGNSTIPGRTASLSSPTTSTRSDPTQPSHAAYEATSEIERLAQGWLIRFDNEKAFVGKIVGVPRLITLLKHPHQDVLALDLMSGSHVGRHTPTGEELSDASSQAGGDVIDQSALREYADMARQLQDGRAEADARGDVEERERIDDQMEWLATQIREGKGKGGRRRQFNTDAERARVAVSRSLEIIMRQLETEAPMLSLHLRQSVQRGVKCRYEPRMNRHWVVR